MKFIAKWLIRTYPNRWRQRYGNEFEALVDDCHVGWLEALDVLKGAISMNFVRWRVVVSACALAGAFVGLGASFLFPQVYVSTAAVAVVNPRGVEGPATVLPNVEKALSRRALTDVIRAQGLYPSDVLKKPLEDVVDDMRRSIRLTTVPPGANFQVSFAYEDRAKAQAATNMLISKIMEANAKEPSLVAVSHRHTLEVTEIASLPQRSVNPYIAKGTIGGLAAGLLLEAIVVRVRRRRHAVA